MNIIRIVIIQWFGENNLYFVLEMKFQEEIR